MKEFELTQDFVIHGYIHCNSQEEFNDMVEWFENNSSVCEGIRYDYNKTYTVYLNGYGLHTCAENYNDSLCSFRDSDDRLIIEWSDYMNTSNEQDFTKDMLKDGMVVECVNGGRYLKLTNNFINNGYMPLDRYNEDLTLKGSDDYDYTVNKIYKSINVPYISELFDDEYLELIWKRKEEKPLELTMEDIESQYGCKVKIVNK